MEPLTPSHRPFRRRAAALVVAAALGGGAGAGAYAAFDSGNGSSTTAAAPAPAPARAAAVQTASTTASITDIYKRTAPGVVDITVTSSDAGSGGFGGPFGPPQGQSRGEGSGFVIDEQGHIVTNAHVVDGATKITVAFPSGKKVAAKLVGSDPSTDTAVIDVDVPASQLTPLTFGDSSTVQVGEGVVAIGSPFGLAGSITSGIVSALNRTIQAPNNYSIAGAIQTDAAINHGNSGGPLLDADGKVIGVNAQIDSQSGGNDGVGFALPINTVKSVANQLIAGGKVEHAYLGVSVGTPASGNGARIASVQPGTPAAKAGVQTGDVVTAVDGKAIDGPQGLTQAISSKKPGDKVTLTVTRNGSTKSLEVTLAARPA